VTGLSHCLDDRWLAPGEAAFAPTHGVIRAGEGWFETLRVETARPMFLQGHLDRLADAIARSLGEDQASLALNAARRCLETLQARFVDFSLGRVRLLLSRDEGRDVPGFGGWQALGEWGAYEPPIDALLHGIDVTIASLAHPGLGVLGKSASYHWSRAARREAHRRGASEALLLRDGFVVEGSTGALAWRRADRWFAPQSAAALPSVTLAALRRAGVVIEPGALAVSSAGGAAKIEVDGLILLSALRLAVPIRSCDGQSLTSASDTAAAWRDALLARHARDLADDLA